MDPGSGPGPEPEPEPEPQPGAETKPDAQPPTASDEDIPDLECAICFSEFNNVFRTPKMLSCQHTFCLECLARMNIKSAQPDSIQCPLCRGFTPLPNLGLPKLATDSTVLSYLPAAMQRVYSIRFSRSKGQLQVKRPTEGDPSLAVQTVSHSLDVGQPSGSGAGRTQSGGAQSQRRGFLAALQRLTHLPACRVFITITTVLLMVLLTVVVIYLIAMQQL